MPHHSACHMDLALESRGRALMHEAHTGFDPICVLDHVTEAQIVSIYLPYDVAYVAHARSVCCIGSFGSHELRFPCTLSPVPTMGKRRNIDEFALRQRGSPIARERHGRVSQRERFHESRGRVVSGAAASDGAAPRPDLSSKSDAR